MIRVVLSLSLALLLAPSASDAAFTSHKCLAGKRQAWGNLRKCQATEHAKLLQGKTPDFAKCETKFEDKLAKLSDKASDATIDCRYRDNGDETVTDYDTGLQWEKKASPGGGTGDPHDIDVNYSWSLSGTNPNGGAFTAFLHQLNACTTPSGIGFAEVGFAFHCDWRLPTVHELRGILLQPAEPCVDPCIDPIFGATAATCYWSSTTLADDHNFAWCVSFGVAGSAAPSKTSAFRVRAVRNAGF